MIENSNELNEIKKFHEIVDKMKGEFCPYCAYLCQNLEEEKVCSFTDICTKSLYLLKKDKPLYFEPIN